VGASEETVDGEGLAFNAPNKGLEFSAPNEGGEVGVEAGDVSVLVDLVTTD